jgi:Integrase core domain
MTKTVLALAVSTALSESFNGKLRDECLNQEIFYSLKEEGSQGRHRAMA